MPQAAEANRKYLSGWPHLQSSPREDDSPIWRRDLLSFRGCDGEGYGKVWGVPDRIEKAFDWPAFENLLAPIHASPRGALGYPPLSPGHARGRRNYFFTAAVPAVPWRPGVREGIVRCWLNQRIEGAWMGRSGMSEP
jgi:hypothetical protein